VPAVVLPELSRSPRVSVRAAAALWALLFAGLCFAWIAVPQFPSACYAQDKGGSHDEIDRRRRELEQLKKELEAKRAKAKELAGKERSVKAQIRELDENLRLTEKYIAKLEQREREVLEELSQLEVRLDDAQGTLEKRKVLLARRLREMYKRGRYRTLAALVSSSSFADVMSHVRFLHLVARRDKQVTAAIKRYQSEVRSTQTELENKKAEIDRLREERESEKKHLAALKKKRQRAMASIVEKKEAHLAAAKELEAAAARIQALIEKLEAQRRAGSGEVPAWASDLAAAQGSVPWPVSGEVVTQFGANVNPRFGTRTYSNGIDIRAPAGTPIRCVADGKVEFVDVLPGYDTCVIVNHGRGYYTLYAHAKDVAVSVGQEVKGGQVIAKVGDGPSLKGNILHFEIRKGKDALNPLNWLVRR